MSGSINKLLIYHHVFDKTALAAIANIYFLEQNWRVILEQTFSLSRYPHIFQWALISHNYYSYSTKFNSERDIYSCSTRLNVKANPI